MDIEAIEIFVKVVQVGSFAEAARQLQVPTTTVSAKIARLENRLNTTLIQRTTRRLNITSAGQAYYQRCVKALSELKAGEDEIENAAQEPMGTLRITCSYDVAHTLLPPIISKYLQQNPKVSVDIIVTNRIVDLVAESVDLAIRAGELKTSDLIAKKFLDLSGGLYVTQNYIKKTGIPSKVTDLEEHDFILFRPFANKKLELSDGKKKVLLDIRGRVSADELETVKVLAGLHLGIAYLPEFLAQDDVNKGRLIRVLPDWSWASGGRLSLVYPAQAFVTPRLRAFLDLATVMNKTT